MIWTNLKSNFKAKSGFDYTEDLALKYLKYLTVNVKNIAEEYIRKAPITIHTSLRKKIEEEMKWYSMEF